MYPVAIYAPDPDLHDRRAGATHRGARRGRRGIEGAGDPGGTLFDSTILIAHLRGDERATSLLLVAAEEGALARVISRAEIERGHAERRGAATAEEEAVPLVTLNVRHFPMFKGLPPW